MKKEEEVWSPTMDTVGPEINGKDFLSELRY